MSRYDGSSLLRENIHRFQEVRPVELHDAVKGLIDLSLWCVTAMHLHLHMSIP